MTAFLTVLLKLSPAFFYVVIGFVVKKIINLPIKWIANSLFYLLVPLMVFKGALYSNPKPFILLIGLAFLVCLFLVIIASFLQHKFKPVLAPGVLKCAFGYFNIGWFGIPIAHALYGNAGANIMAALYIGGMLFGNTCAYLLISQNNIAGKDSLKKLLFVPAIYSVLIAFFLHLLPIRQIIINNHSFQLFFHYVTVTTSLFGMGLVGISVADTVFKKINYPMLFLLLFYRLLAASIIMSIMILVFYKTGMLTPLEVKIVSLMPMLPIAAGILVFTTKSEVKNDFISVCLLASTILSFLLLVIVLTFL